MLTRQYKICIITIANESHIGGIMKKILSILGLFLLSLIFISCTNNKNAFSIVCMSYSEYDWVKNLKNRACLLFIDKQDEKRRRF